MMLGTLVVPACTGEDPALSVTLGDGGGTPPTTSGTPDTGGGSDSGGPTCPKDLGDCDGDPSTGCEASLLAPDNCGSCRHACGGTAACIAGQCAPETVSSTLDHPFGFALAGQRALWLSPDAVFGCTVANCATSTAIMVDYDTSTVKPVPGQIYSPRQIAVDGTTFYYDTCTSALTGCAPAACPITGCKSGGAINGSTPVVTTSSRRRPTVLFGGPGAIYTYHGLDGLNRYSLPAPSTVTYPKMDLHDYFGDGYVDAQHFVYIDNNQSLANPTGGLYVCPADGCVGTRGATLLPPPVRLLAVANDIAFTTSGGNANRPSASVIACSITGCGGAGTILAQNQAYISDIVADDRDVFWATIGAADPTTNTAPVGTIMRCSLPSCTGGPQKIADQVLNPVGIQLDADYVYWITYGTGTNKNGTLVRSRR
ncbi:hypothetical protein AKJ09_04216 [Labilithrix luteola]|uniref:Uncharacterized protein n=1 Tax=Labilithrix luteola TaxID=1391654 RepID=A0A0K1PVJ7_9BACT|nr:hypothetical protein AKJ09_04216 [Labilithrix luteola]